MAYLAVDKDGTEWIFEAKPSRRKNGYWDYKSKYCNYSSVKLPKGTIKKLVGRELTWEDEPYRITRNTFDPEKQMEVELNSPAPMTRVVMLFKVHKLIPIESPGMVRSELEKIIGEPYFNELRSMGFIEGNWIQDSVSKIAYYQYKLTELGMNYCNELFR